MESQKGNISSDGSRLDQIIGGSPIIGALVLVADTDTDSNSASRFGICHIASQSNSSHLPLHSFCSDGLRLYLFVLFERHFDYISPIQSKYLTVIIQHIFLELF
jgi:hypothetical protein